ncbi:hypothetical protein KP803_19250 [Vibrio sp. ZSDE26]|uniref:Uncharacterized protein n=1 Tax=Vibrio amylolyticus TaxID=2847292 RepID=A0A9X1XQL2_9VIBR|nr:hypothetical protein [Vibrio amylolyticus]MCK6265408.1 hypothetical protein [Vibrio amylolyticus]
MQQDDGLVEHGYFTEMHIDTILENLDIVRKSMFERETAEGELEQKFPSVCLIGLGRCGSNIALDVATLVYNARSNYFTDDCSELKSNTQEKGPVNWLKGRLSGHADSRGHPVYLIEPVVMVGDLDKDIEGRIRYSTSKGRLDFLENYKKIKIMDLSEVHAGGAGNAPILGQYLAKTILNRKTSNFSNETWRYLHSYLVDSCGIKANQSRLYFYIFSSGGGTGSGMASEFGLAQQYSYMSKTFDLAVPKSSASSNKPHSFVFEPIFTSGICILPNIWGDNVEPSEALHINSGRLLCKYLSEEWSFSYNLDAIEDGIDSSDVLSRIRPWNAMMLISNDIMRYAENGEEKSKKEIDVNKMEKYANQYISQQIFNILTAQAVTSDYDENYFRKAGIDIAETIRLDANDLFMSLAGPVAIAYSESVVGSNRNGPTDVDDLFYRSIELPHFNQQTQAIEGISLLPVESTKYEELLRRYKEANFELDELKELHFFKNCSSIVSIISLPKDYKLTYTSLNRLKSHINRLFPNTTLKRYALVIGTSPNLSLTTLVSKSPCLSDDFLTLIVAYVKRCFAKDEFRYSDTIDRVILKAIKEDEFNEEEIKSYFLSYENPAKVLDTNWYAIKPMYEKKYRELITDKKKFTSINDIRLTSDCVIRAIKYIREIYRHKISKTSIVSLNSNLSLSEPLPKPTITSDTQTKANKEKVLKKKNILIIDDDVAGEEEN